ncbi:MAG: 4Fe-4S binding protein [Rikenellaceae bacterium]|nr:4Fe-4S binding protein [Rikenellaceae bacterium]MCD7962676.1 4Fe-4S binding protein [Rikenellaceae bacterium]
MAYKIDEGTCTACGTCIDECPVEAITAGDVYTIDPDTCIDCGACAGVCPVEAIQPE